MFNVKDLDVTSVIILVDSYNDGKASLTSIAKDLGCSIPTVSRILKKNGVTLRGKGRPKGSKTVNRKPKVVATSTPTADDVTSAESVVPKVENLAVTTEPTTAFSAFQQKVMQFTKPV